jgi:hypothetical protein
MATQEGRVDEDRVNDQGPSVVIASDSETNLSWATDDIRPDDRLPAAFDLLVHKRTPLTQQARRCSDEEITSRVDVQPLRAFESQTYLLIPGTWLDEQVVFELTLTAVVHNIDSFVHVLVSDAAKRRYINAPSSWVFADEVMDTTRELV